MKIFISESIGRRDRVANHSLFFVCRLRRGLGEPVLCAQESNTTPPSALLPFPLCADQGETFAT
jgi:hypothetical protein